MFERFTDRARRVVVLAQEEARLLDHNYIGTEHILLGLIHEGEGIAYQALQSLGIDLDAARGKVEEIIGHGGITPSGHIPFTPRAKKVLELSLRESLQLGHNYVGTEHILLGMIHEGEGVAAHVLVALGPELSTVRTRVIEMATAPAGDLATHVPLNPTTVRAPARDAGARVQPVCSFCGRDLWDADHYLEGEAGAICDECIHAAHALLNAAPSDEPGLELPVRIYGSEPHEGAVDAITQTLRQAFSADRVTERLASVENGTALLARIESLLARHQMELPRAVRIDRIRFLDDRLAIARIADVSPRVTVRRYEIRITRIDDQWMVSQDSFIASIVPLIGDATP